MKKCYFYILIVLILLSIVFPEFLMRKQITRIINISDTINDIENGSHFLVQELTREQLSYWLAFWHKSKNASIRNLVFLSFIEVVNLVSAGLILYGVLKNPARLTYEEYKEQAETRRLARQEKKRAALEEKQKSIQDELDRMK